ncbi:DUF1272 domain-containing protein [Hyphococcus luteus]|uniref:DUF1272 domain-containing protein n=1 Tax=Hyphococcus luteus TaxID=2058213 RepID=A0A2S7K5J5_9PROT|nr:DUF1272 domain-containing protein [Marinicaulis flavus]
MLEIRPNFEWCDKDLPPDAVEARICTYECAFCATCVDTVLHNVCPNCGGGFAPRPIRPKTPRRNRRILCGPERHAVRTTMRNRKGAPR